MATKIIMPKQGLQMTEGTITNWLVAEGEKITLDQPLFEMETDKLTIEIGAGASGTLLKIVKNVGEVVPITETIAVIGEPGEDISEFFVTDMPADALKHAKVAEQNMHTPAGELQEAGDRRNRHERVFITPRAKRVALEKGLNYLDIEGTGPQELIIERDVLAYDVEVAAEVRENKTAVENRSGNIIPFTGIRKVISDKMMQSIHGMAQANHKIKVDMSEVIQYKEILKLCSIKVTFTDILVHVVSKALLEFPILNSSLTDEGILLKNHVNMGIAVAVENGLIVPVIKDADLMTIKEIATVSAALIDKAKNGGLKPDEYSGGTFTVTNLGMFDIDEFTAIINPPESAILAAGKIDRIPVAEGDKIVIRPVMTLSLTYDHRIIDGAPAALFLQRVKQIMLHPDLLI